MNYKILIAEDDKNIVELLTMYLVNEGYEVISRDNGLDAYSVLENEKIDLAIFDIMMPKMNGYELTKKARNITNIPIIILSAKNKDNDKIVGLNIGADDYLPKPFNPLEVIARVKACLRRYYSLNSSLNDNSNIIKVGDLSLDTEKFTIYKRGDQINLKIQLKFIIIKSYT